MAKPTHDDATLMLQLAQMLTAPNVQEALDFAWSDEFKRDPQAIHRGTPESRKLQAVLGTYETIGTLYKHHLINEDLLFDWLAANMVWDRVRDYALARRKESGSDALWENFELMAKADEAWNARRMSAVGASTANPKGSTHA